MPGLPHPRLWRGRRRFSHTSIREKKNMRSFTICLLLLVFFTAPGSRARAQSNEPAGKTESAPAGATSAGATKEEVEQLRQEVTAQRQTIEQLKTMVQQLLEAKSKAPAADGAQLVNAALVPSAGQALTGEKPAEKKKPPRLRAGTVNTSTSRAASSSFRPLATPRPTIAPIAATVRPQTPSSSAAPALASRAITASTTTGTS